MTHCVPDWDGHGGELDAIIASTDYLPPVKGKGWSLLPKRSPSDLASLQSSDVPSVWTDNAQLAPKLNGSGVRSPDWQQVNSTNWPSTAGTEDAVPPSKPPTSEPHRHGILSVDVPVMDHADRMGEDEMVSWLQYPLDDNLEKTYCSEFFGELPNSTVTCVNSIKDSLVSHQGGQPSNRLGRSQLSGVTSGPNGALSRVVSADAAMAMGAGRAAGVLPQAGVEAFTKVRTVQPYSAAKWTPTTAGSPGKTLGAPSTTSFSQNGRAPPAILPNVSASALPAVKTQPVPLQPARKGTAMNFSHFSVPAMKASLHCMGMSSHNVQAQTQAQNRAKTPYLPILPTTGTRPFDTSTSTGSSIAESTTTRLQSEASASRNEADVHVDGGSEGQQPSLATESSWPSSMQNSQISAKGAEAAVDSAGNQSKMDSTTEASPADLENRQQNCRDTSTGAPQSGEKLANQALEIPEVPEPTLTSSSGGSGNSGKGAANKGKRRSREEETSECQSDDAEDEVVELKKPQPRTGTAKRTRAAEVHNLSERRRRDRINEKMKALQELIPNSNKADKASMLDEAIEYLKMLQIQLQMMSMRSGMSIPSLIPNRMQHLQVSGMGGMAPMGMGMGMGLGMGMGMGPMVGMGGMPPMSHMGMLEMNSIAAGRSPHLIPHLAHAGTSHSASPMMPHPTHGGPSYNVSQVITHPSRGGSSHNLSATPPAVPMVDSSDPRLQSSSALESVYLARQHTLQMTPQTMDVYNAYMIHQQQQHQQQQQQHQQQHQQQQQQQQHHQHQEQHHQLHHMSNNMGSGSLQ